MAADPGKNGGLAVLAHYIAHARHGLPAPTRASEPRSLRDLAHPLRNFSSTGSSQGHARQVRVRWRVMYRA